MREELISFDTDRLAKEKGFDLHICTCGGYPECICDQDKERPTQSLLQRWLREEHGLHIEVCVDLCDDLETMCFRGFNILTMKEYDRVYTSNEFYKLYEEVLEKGLMQGLKLVNIHKR